MRYIIIVGGVIASLTCPAVAQERGQSGNDLIEACRLIANGATPTSDNALQVGFCSGELEALNWLAPGVNDGNLRACVPDSETPQQIAKVVVDYFDSIRGRLREPFEGLALEALAHTWPCAQEPGWFGKKVPAD
jgi:hypothetical protein